MLEMFQNGELKPLIEQYSAAPEANNKKPIKRLAFYTINLTITYTDITK